MIAMLFSWLTGGGLAGIGKQLREAYKDKLDAQNNEDRIRADVRIKELEARQAALHEAAAVRKATKDQWEMRIIVFAAGFPPALHFAAVCFVSTFPAYGWTVEALPPPMDDWQGSILLSLFGLSAIKFTASVFGRRR